MKHDSPLQRVSVSSGISGDWRVERFTVSAADANFENMRAAIGAASARPISAGTYTRLMKRGSLVMSDTPMEMVDHTGFVRRATGRVLVGGLGLGVVLQGLLRKKDVTHVTVVEVSPDVMALVGRHYQAKGEARLTLVLADVLTWTPAKGQCWDYAWFDIWNAICADNIPQMHRLRRRFTRRVTDIGFWCYYEHLRAARRYA